MSDMQIEMIVDEKALVGEGPVWDPNTSVLYWTDIRGGRYFKYDPATGNNETIHNGIFVGGAAGQQERRSDIRHLGRRHALAVRFRLAVAASRDRRCESGCSSTM